MPPTVQRGPARRFDGVEVLFKNFRGAGPPEKPFNNPGNRNFNLVIPTPELVDELMAEGWNVKCLKPLEEGATPKCIIEVKVEFDKGRPPNITVITSRGRTKMTKDTVESLDMATFTNVDLIMQGSYWDVNGRQGMKAYLQTMFVTIYEDPLELKYGEMPEDIFEDEPPFVPDHPAF